MIIEKVRVENFRLLKNFEIDLKEGLSLVVGKNNCGKTSVLTIMDNLLNCNNSVFKWEDFNLEFQESFREKIFKYVKRKDGIQDFGGIKMTLFINYDEKDSFLNIKNFMMDLEEDNNYVVLEFYYSCKEDKIQQLQNDLEMINISNTKNDQIKFTKFMKKHSSEYFTMQRYSRGYNCSTKELTDEISDEIRMNEINKLIKFKHIKANRDATNKANDHSLSSLSAKYYKSKNDPDALVVDDFQEVIMKMDDQLNRVYNGGNSEQGIFSDIIKSINDFGGQSKETKITIQSSIGDKELLKENTTLYYEHSGNHLPESYNGLGYLNLIGMIFEIETIISELGNEDNGVSDINILFIEEPEAHTHPQLQYIFIKNIKKLIKTRCTEDKKIKLALQTVLSTHSSHIVSECDFDDIRYLKLGSNGIESKNFEILKKKYEGDTQAFKFVKQHLTLSRSELFFADKAIFIEGDTERILLPFMMKKIDEEIHEHGAKEDDERVENNYLPLSSQNISIIEAGAYAHKFKHLIDFLGITVLIITDIDAAKKNNNNRLEGCSPCDATHTTNASLKGFFNLNDDPEQFNNLRSNDLSKKIFNNQYCVVYQTCENDYQANSFEDAFICTNIDFVIANKANFEQGLKNRTKINNGNQDYYLIAKDCINKKSAFATEILYFDGFTKEKEWKVPEYIKEGLIWLKNR